MSEEIKAKIIDEENPSIAEKETKALKKIGADTGVDTVTKVDLRQPLNKEEDAIQEQSTDEVSVRDESSASQEIQKENETQPEESAEQSQKEEKEEIVEELVQENNVLNTEPEINKPLDQNIEIPEGVNELIKFMQDTGGTLEDYVKLNKDYSKFENNDLVKEYYNTTKPHLNSEEIDFLIKDKFSYDEEIDDATNVKRKQLAYKEEIAKAKNFLEDQKNKYYKEVKMSDNLNKDQQKAIDFFNRYNNEQKENAQIQEKVRNGFKLKTDEVFNQEFKGFDFNIDNKKFQFKVKDVDKVKNNQMDIMNVVGSYLSDEDGLKDGYGYHKALFAAQNADSIANHFYQLGKTEAVKEISAESKNINMDPRQTSSGVVESGGIKVRAISGDDSSKLRIKLKK